ncbi:GRP family sugar transporter [Leuconostocaceae bacterium ESL0723]|nr:GRP family sugar transporter [Lactobacillaceae bacterium L1_55_11]WEV54815.1 GRP family sugar transporter [Leuconostocaceae bacterium ESL0723]
MNAALLLALLPALFWGSTGIISTKMGGNAAQQTLGMTFGALLFGLGTMLFYVLPKGIYFGSRIWVVGVLSGLVWAVGTAFQFLGNKEMGVSISMPLSTAGQIVMNALLAATLLGEWENGKMWLIGLVSIAVVVLGATFISMPDKRLDGVGTVTPKGMLYIVISTIGYMFYFILPNYLAKLGYISPQIKEAGRGVDYMTAIVAPQAIGQVLGAFIIAIFVLKSGSIMFEKPTWKNMATGLAWALGNIFMFISTADPAVGQTIATTFSQLGIIVSAFGGVYILHERKTHRQMIYILLGTILVIVGAIIIGNIHQFA